MIDLRVILVALAAGAVAVADGAQELHGQDHTHRPVQWFQAVLSYDQDPYNPAPNGFHWPLVHRCDPPSAWAMPNAPPTASQRYVLYPPGQTILSRDELIQELDNCIAILPASRYITLFSVYGRADQIVEVDWAYTSPQHIRMWIHAGFYDQHWYIEDPDRLLPITVDLAPPHHLPAHIPPPASPHTGYYSDDGVHTQPPPPLTVRCP